MAAGPVRAVVLAQRVLPQPLRGWLRLAGPYGRAAALWGAGDRAAALASLNASPRRLAAFSLAVDQPETAAAALTRLSDDDRARPVLAARLAWREGRLTEAIQALDHARGRRARRLRTRLTAERAVLQGDSMIVDSSGQIQSISVHDHESTRTKGRVLHLVNDALPTTSAGYTIRTHEIVLAQKAAGLDPHVVTRSGFPVTQGTLDGRRLVTLDGIPYHRLLPWRMPARADKAAGLALEMAARLTEKLRPAVLHAASNYVNATIALAIGKKYGLPVVYEVRGFWEDTWLSRHPDSEKMASSELYRRSRDLETRCMLAADLVVTLGEAVRTRSWPVASPPGKSFRAERRIARGSSSRCPMPTHFAKNSASRQTSTSSARCPPWSRTRASAPCSRRPSLLRARPAGAGADRRRRA